VTLPPTHLPQALKRASSILIFFQGPFRPSLATSPQVVTFRLPSLCSPQGKRDPPHPPPAHTCNEAEAKLVSPDKIIPYSFVLMARFYPWFTASFSFLYFPHPNGQCRDFQLFSLCFARLALLLLFSCCRQLLTSTHASLQCFIETAFAPSATAGVLRLPCLSLRSIRRSSSGVPHFPPPPFPTATREFLGPFSFLSARTGGASSFFSSYCVFVFLSAFSLALLHFSN